MANEKKRKLFLVDDDVLFLKALEIEFTRHSDFSIETFSTGEHCIERLQASDEENNGNPDVIILDYHLDSVDPNAMNGLDVLSRIKALNPKMPVLMLSSQDKIDVAVNCMRHNAFDYIVKSETAFFRLKKSITTIFQNQKTEKQLNWYMDRM